MFNDAFTKLDKVQAARMAGLVNPHLDIPFDPDTVTVMVHNLSFYPDHFLAEMTNHAENPPVTRLAICNDKGDVKVLNWTNAPIFDLNKSVPILLNEETVADYARFFFTFVRGKHGRFLIVDTVDDIDWRDEPAPAGRKALARMIEQLHIKRTEKDKSVVLGASIIFRDSLFAGEIVVQPDGQVTMQKEELLVEDIPVADDVFGM